MKRFFIILSLLMVFFGIFGTFATSTVFAREGSSLISSIQQEVKSNYLSIKELELFTAKENLSFTVRNANGIPIPQYLD
ncbi:MAG: hypothetical protein NZM09_09230 [Ignavibacterium sp.]|nr:hypothetical protein [Ignavibacterium sp.]MDW8375863.1 hypothetical protein [Ignavibacteriales bacterium]